MMQTFPATTTVRPPGRTAPIEVWKFGGTSVADQHRLHEVAERMAKAHHEGRRVVAVLSAMGESTTELSDRARAVTERPALRELDALLSVGESVSCALTAMTLHELGVPAVSLDAAQAGIRTDDHHGNARLRDVRPDRVLAELDAGAVVLVTGFQGVADNGDTTTLGRGGSDATAVAVASALGQDRCQIFTDVGGVFTAHPHLVPEARPLASLRHEEMLELAEGGAGVLQPRAVELAAAHGVDVHLRSSFTHDDGTWIRRAPRPAGQPDVAGVAHRDHEPVYAVTGLSAATVAEALAGRGATIGLLATQEDAVRFSAPAIGDAEVVETVAAAGGVVRERADVGSVSVVSTGIGRKPEIPARTVRTLADAGIEPVATITTSGRVCAYVDAGRVADAVRLLHAAFVVDDGRAEHSTAAPPAREEVR